MGDDKAARPPGRGRLRAAHADREQVVDVLKAAFVQDRLTKDEFDARVGQALASRTYADLAALTADLPADLPAGPAPVAPARPPRAPVQARPGNATVRKGARVIAVTTAITASAWAGALLTSADNQAVGTLLWAVTFMWFGIVLVIGSVMIEAQLKKDPGRELPPPPPRRRGQASGPGVAGVQT
jgi:hypothetical protein